MDSNQLIEFFEEFGSVKAILIAVFGAVIAPGLQAMKPKAGWMGNPIAMFLFLVVICGVIVTGVFWGFDGKLGYAQSHFVYTMGMALAAILMKTKMKAASQKNGG
jgi:hypothetical protein